MIRFIKISIITLALTSMSGIAYASTGDITAVRIIGNTTTITDPHSACNFQSSCNGWVAEVDISGFTSTSTSVNMGLGANNDPSTAKISFTVSSPGYDTSGKATTTTRVVYGTNVLRLPYPYTQTSPTFFSTYDEATSSGKLTVLVVLSDFIYSADTVTFNAGSSFYTDNGSGGTGLPNNATSSLVVTNNSALTYPKTIGHFALEQRRPVDGMTNVEVFAVQKFGKSGEPVAVVNITATGATSGHVETGTTTAMVLSSRGDGLPVYSVPLNLSVAAGFTRGEAININFKAYPWVGTSSAILNSDLTTNGGDGSGINYLLGPLVWTIMDKMIGVVDPSGGNDSSCVASLTQATADASPCQTINGALTAIAAQNNSSYSLNEVDGGDVQLKAGTYAWNPVGGQTVNNGYFTIEPHSSTNQAGVVLDTGSNHSQYIYQRFYNITMDRSSNGYIIFAGGSDVLVMEKINFTDSYGPWYSGDNFTDIEVLDSTTGNDFFTPGGNDGHSRLNRDNTYTNNLVDTTVVGNASCVLELKGSGGSSNIWNGLVAGANNIIIAYTKWYSKSDGALIEPNAALTNVALVNNLVERIGSSVTPLWEISAAVGVNQTDIINWYNSYVGQRENHENDWNVPSNGMDVNWGSLFNIFDARGNHRADIRAASSSISGTWDVDQSVGWTGNWDEAYSYGGDQDFWGLDSNSPSGSTYPVGFVADNSQFVANTGEGDYHLTSSASALNLVPAGMATMPYDLDGNARRNDGTGAAGAYEYVVASPSNSYRFSISFSSFSVHSGGSFEIH